MLIFKVPICLLCNIRILPTRKNMWKVLYSDLIRHLTIPHLIPGSSQRYDSSQSFLGAALTVHLHGHKPPIVTPIVPRRQMNCASAPARGDEAHQGCSAGTCSIGCHVIPVLAIHRPLDLLVFRCVCVCVGGGENLSPSYPFHHSEL